VHGFPKGVVVFEDVLLSETPIEGRGNLWFKREDLFEFAGMRGAKVRAALLLCLRAKEQGCSTVVSAGSRYSPQLAIVGAVCRELGLQAVGFVIAGSITSVLNLALLSGVSLRSVKARYSSVVKAQARRWALDNNAFLVPFGMLDDAVIDLTKFQARSLVESGVLDGVKRVVMFAGSGVNLVGVLSGLRECLANVPVVGVMVGHDCRKFVHSRCNYNNLSFVHSTLPYDSPSFFSKVNCVDVDLRYEGKAVPFLRPGDLFWDIGFVSVNVVEVAKEI
jgi:1-aminocyclopropane-1-carboxylate deaminase/D-cysteine desulfhydrase-like pyridoxal-dependent ACC family enzyme